MPPPFPTARTPGREGAPWRPVSALSSARSCNTSRPGTGRRPVSASSRLRYAASSVPSWARAPSPDSGASTAESATCAPTELGPALGLLFESLDKDHNGVIDLEEFVAGRAAAGDSASSEVLEHFLKALDRGGSQGNDGGWGLGFEAFGRWQLRQLAAVGLSQEAAVAACAKLAMEIQQQFRDSAVASPVDMCQVVHPPSPEAVPLAAKRPPRRWRGGGGQSTTKWGFKEDVREVLRDIRAFERLQKALLQEESSDSEDEKRRMAERAEASRVLQAEEAHWSSYQAAHRAVAKAAWNLRQTRLVEAARKAEAQKMNAFLNQKKFMKRYSSVDLGSISVSKGQVLQNQGASAQAQDKRLEAELNRCRKAERKAAELLLLRGIVRQLSGLTGGPGIPHARLELRSVDGDGALLDASVSGHQADFCFRPWKSENAASPSWPLKPSWPLCVSIDHPKFASSFCRLLKGGARQMAFQMLPLAAELTFHATPGSKEVAQVTDSESGTSFLLPLGHLLKEGIPFEGSFTFSMAVVPLVNKTSMGAAATASASVPWLIGRTVGGRPVTMRPLESIFTSFKDPSDGASLVLKPGKGVRVTLPHIVAAFVAEDASPMSYAPSLKGRRRVSTMTVDRTPTLRTSADEQTPRHFHMAPMASALSEVVKWSNEHPSLWRFHPEKGEWQEGRRPLQVGERELFPLGLEGEAKEIAAISDAMADQVPPEAGRLHQEKVAAAAELRAGAQKLFELRQNLFLPKICLCGFATKQLLLPGIRKLTKLRLADPPKRIFCATEPDEDFGIKEVYPCQTKEEMAQSELRAASDPEVELSHHLASIEMLLLPTKKTLHTLGLTDASEVGGAQHYRKVAEPLRLHLKHVADWMVARGRTVLATSGELLPDEDPMLLRLFTLERLVSTWQRPRSAGAAPATLFELREALLARRGDIALAFMDVAMAQVRRDEVGHVLQILKRLAPLLEVTFAEVQLALARSGGNCSSAATTLVRDGEMRRRVEIQQLRDRLRPLRPSGCPTNAQVEQALQEAKELCRQAEAERVSKEAAAARANEEAVEAAQASEAAQEECHEALKRCDPGARLRAGEAARRERTRAAAAQALRARHEAAALAAAEAAEAERRLHGPARRLAKDSAVHDMAPGSELPSAAWNQALKAAQRQDVPLTFEIGSAGWDIVALPEAVKLSTSGRRRGLQDLEETNPIADDLFPSTQRTLCPIPRMLSVVLGSFGMTLVGAVKDVTCRAVKDGTGWTEEIGPDGLFCLVTALEEDFELWVTRTDEPQPLRFGPFVALPDDEVTFVGVLELEDARTNWNGAAAVLTEKVHVLLPVLEIPPLSTAAERCSCQDFNFEDDN